MTTSAVIGACVLAAAAAIGVCTSPRVPWMRARQKRRGEQRILGVLARQQAWLDHPAREALITPGLPRDGRPLDDCEKRILGRISMDALIDIPEPAYDHRRQA